MKKNTARKHFFQAGPENGAVYISETIRHAMVLFLPKIPSETCAALVAKTCASGRPRWSVGV